MVEHVRYTRKRLLGAIEVTRFHQQVVVVPMACGRGVMFDKPTAPDFGRHWGPLRFAASILGISAIGGKMKREQLSCNAINRIAEASPLGYFAPPRLSEGRCRAPSLIRASLGVCWSIAIGSSLIREMNSFEIGRAH